MHFFAKACATRARSADGSPTTEDTSFVTSGAGTDLCAVVCSTVQVEILRISARTFQDFTRLTAHVCRLTLTLLTLLSGQNGQSWAAGATVLHGLYASSAYSYTNR